MARALIKAWYNETGEHMTIKEMLTHLGYQQTTPVQDGVFNAFKSQKHIVAVAKTGTGKTHAYLLPILESIAVGLDHVQAVIVVPTNELVTQVERMLNDADPSVSVKAYSAGQDKKRELLWLSKKQPQIVISTPGRLFELVVKDNALKIMHTRTFVLDEADMMFDHDFMDMIDNLLPAMKEARYILLSATITKAMKPFLKAYFGQHILVDTTALETLLIEHRRINIKTRPRLEVLSDVVDAMNPYVCLLFASRIDDLEAIRDMLLAKGHPTALLSGQVGIRARQAIIEDVRKLKYSYLVTSDLAARGLDLDVSHIIHFDLPRHLEFYVHRCGRTGRMNATGMSILLHHSDEHRKIEKLTKQGVMFTEYTLKSGDMVRVKDPKKTISDQEKLAMKSIRTPKKVKPNYKKKYQAQVDKARKTARRKVNAQNR